MDLDALAIRFRKMELQLAELTTGKPLRASGDISTLNLDLSPELQSAFGQVAEQLKVLQEMEAQITELLAFKAAVEPMLPKLQAFAEGHPLPDHRPLGT